MLFKNILNFRHFVNWKTKKYYNCSRKFSSLYERFVDFKNPQVQNYLEGIRKEFYNLRIGGAQNPSLYERSHQLSAIVGLLEEQLTLQKNIIGKDEIDKEKDEDMQQLMKEENKVYKNLIEKTELKLQSELLVLTDEYYSSLIFEINAGAGGQEAMLFAKQLVEMYKNYFMHNDWQFEILDEDSIDIGGIRHANIVINDLNAYNVLRYEAGVHRVQRIPLTEKAGRIHTSTVSVTVIPRPANINVSLADKDLKFETKRASGAGGQHVNTTDSAVRIVHIPSGIAVECQTERSQIKNKELALKRLREKLINKQLQKNEVFTKSTRKSQQGNLDRNEKIRTYNFVQDRITDHRIKDGTIFNLAEFLKGGHNLDNLIQRVKFETRKTYLLELMHNWKDDK